MSVISAVNLTAASVATKALARDLWQPDPMLWEYWYWHQYICKEKF